MRAGGSHNSSAWDAGKIVCSEFAVLRMLMSDDTVKRCVSKRWVFLLE